MPSPERTLDVLVVDGDPLVLRTLARQLQAEEGLRVTAVALDADHAFASAGQQPPDVAVIDPWLQGLGGPEVIAELHRLSPKTSILVLSRNEDAELALAVLRAGASGFLPKEVSQEVLPRVVRAIARGEAVLTRTMTRRLVERLRELPEPGAGLRPVRSVLTSREWEVLDLLVAGLGTRDVAAELELSTETVRSHVKRILRKLGAHSRAEAIERARALVRHQEGPAHSAAR